MATEKKKPEISQEQALEIGLSVAELRVIISLLGRGPTEHEALVFRVIWSEEIAEVNSRNVLKFFHNEEEKYRRISGTHASLVPLDESTSLAMCCNSSLGGVAIHPLLGIQTHLEATLNDLRELGATPVASSLVLRLGQASNIEHIKFFQELVAGSSKYLLHSGIPLADIDYFFHSKFKHQPVVNSFALGVVDSANLEIRIANDKEYVLLLLGSPTDPLQRPVSRASASAPDSATYASLVVGDPVWASRLSGCVQDALNSKKVLAVQKIAKGGLVAALFALAERTGQAYEVQLDRVPVTVADITPRDVMLSESPGRYLVAVSKEDYKDLHEVFDKWKIKSTVVGELTRQYGIKLIWRHNELVDIPIKRVLEATPYSEYQLLTHPPMLKENTRHEVEQSRIEQVGELGGVGSVETASVTNHGDEEEEVETSQDEEEQESSGAIEVPVYLNDTWMDLLGNHAFADRSRLLRLYDRGVGNEVFTGFRDSSVLRVKCRSGEKIIISTLVSKPLFVINDTYLGAAHTVAEAMRNLSCVGAEPLAALACFNFGNPRKYKDLCDMSEILRGAGDACRFWKIPVASEDLSVNSVRAAQGLTPTMTLQMLGVLDHRESLLTCSFRAAGDVILVLGDTKREIEATEYSYYCHQRTIGRVPSLDYEHETKISSLIRNLVKINLLKSAHAVGDGGLAVALADGCLTSYPPLGAEVSLDTKMSAKDFRADALLFSETSGRFLVSCRPEAADEIKRLAREAGVFVGGQGVVGGRSISVKSPIECSISLPTAYKVWTQGIHTLFGEE